MVQEIRKLCAEYPLFVVVRLCTSEQDVVDYYNEVDEEVEFSLDVLCNLESEAREIQQVDLPLYHKLNAPQYTVCFDYTTLFAQGAIICLLETLVKLCHVCTVRQCSDGG